MKTRNYLFLKLTTGLLGSIVALLLTLSTSSVYAQDNDKYEKYDVVVEIKGMSCLFCSYNVEKNLNKREEIKQTDVSLLDGVAKLILEKDEAVNQKQIARIVTDAGYKVGKFLKLPGEPVAERSASPEESK